MPPISQTGAAGAADRSPPAPAGEHDQHPTAILTGISAGLPRPPPARRAGTPARRAVNRLPRGPVQLIPALTPTARHRRRPTPAASSGARTDGRSARSATGGSGGKATPHHHTTAHDAEHGHVAKTSLRSSSLRISRRASWWLCWYQATPSRPGPNGQRCQGPPARTSGWPLTPGLHRRAPPQWRRGVPVIDPLAERTLAGRLPPRLASKTPLWPTGPVPTGVSCLHGIARVPSIAVPPSRRCTTARPVPGAIMTPPDGSSTLPPLGDGLGPLKAGPRPYSALRALRPGFADGGDRDISALITTPVPSLAAGHFGPSALADNPAEAKLGSASEASGYLRQWGGTERPRPQIRYPVCSTGGRHARGTDDQQAPRLGIRRTSRGAVAVAETVSRVRSRLRPTRRSRPHIRRDVRQRIGGSFCRPRPCAVAGMTVSAFRTGSMSAPASCRRETSASRRVKRLIVSWAANPSAEELPETEHGAGGGGHEDAALTVRSGGEPAEAKPGPTRKRFPRATIGVHVPRRRTPEAPCQRRHSHPGHVSVGFVDGSAKRAQRRSLRRRRWQPSARRDPPARSCRRPSEPPMAG